MKRYFGCHVSVAGGFENGIKNGSELGVNSIQVHPSPPQRWNTKAYDPGYEDKFLEAKESSKIEKVFFHAIYLINLATPDNRKFSLAKMSLVNYLDLMARIQGDGVVVHVGSMKDQPDEKEGLARATEGVNAILAEAKNDARLILEVAAGAGKIIGSRMEELAEIYEGVEEKERVGFGLDSQHMWASGYNLREDLAGVIKSLKENFGIEKTWLVHLNDSMTDFDSKRDRHENFGDGKIGSEALEAFLNHKELKEIPFVLETPALKEMETAAAEVKKVQKLLK